MYLKLFRHAEYESILEGEIIETGAGFVMKRRLTNLKELFDIGKKKPTQKGDRSYEYCNMGIRHCGKRCGTGP